MTSPAADDQNSVNPYAAPMTEPDAATNAAWSAQSDLRLFGKWAGLIAINSLVAGYFGFMLVRGSAAGVAGIGLGMVIWWLICAAFDRRLLKAGRTLESRALVISCVIKAALQIFFVVDVFAGMFAIIITSQLTTNDLMEGGIGATPDSHFTETFLITFFTGAMSAGIIAILYTITASIMRRRQLKRSVQQG